MDTQTLTNNTKHPSGLWLLFALGVMLMFGSIAFQSLLVLFFTHKLHFDNKHAYTVMTAYLSLSYSIALLGGYLSSRFFSAYYGIVIGFFLGAIGLFLTPLPLIALSYLGMAFSILGISLIAPNIFVLLGDLYDAGHIRRDSGFTLLYTGLNLGAFAGFMSLGYLVDDFGYVAAFDFAGLFFCAGFLLVLYNKKLLNSTEKAKEKQSKKMTCYGLLLLPVAIGLTYFLLHYPDLCRILIGVAGIALIAYLIKLTRTHPPRSQARYGMWVFIGLLLVSIVFWALYILQQTTLVIYIQDYVNREILGHIIPTPTVLGIGAGFMLLLGPLFSALWLNLNKRGFHATSSSKFALALFSIGVAFLALFIGSYLTADKSSLIWIILFFFFISVAEMVLAPAGYALIGKLADRKLDAFLMASWRFKMGVAAAFSGPLALLTVTNRDILATTHNYQNSFLIYAAIACLTALLASFIHQGFKNKITI